MNERLAEVLAENEQLRRENARLRHTLTAIRNSSEWTAEWMRHQAREALEVDDG